MAITQLTNAGAALLAANTGPITLSAYKLGSAVNYVPEPTDTDIHGSLVLAGAPSLPVAMSANVVKYGVYLDYGTGPYSFGELGLFTSDGTLFALVAWNELINKLPVTVDSGGNSIRIDVYLSVVGENYDMWLDLASSSNSFRMAILGSVDVLPQSQSATPNAYVVSGLSQFQSSFIAYTDRAGLWNFDAYDFAAQHVATVTGSTGQSVTIDLGDWAADMDPSYLGQVIIEFSTGQLYSTCRYVESAVTVGDHVTFGFATSVMVEPAAGDQMIVWVRRLATTEIPLPIATHNALGGVVVGQSLTVDADGVIDVDPSKIAFPVTSVAGRTGNVVLSAADISGLAAVATSGLYSDLTGVPTPYVLPVATLSTLGGVKAPASGRLTIAGDGTIDLGSTIVTSVAGRTGAVALTYEDISGLAVVAHTGSYNDLSDKPTIPDPYVLVPAQATVLGGIKVGTGLSVTADGTLSTNGGYVLPVATTTVLGGVKQGSNVTIAGDGSLSVAAPYTLVTASASVLGGIKVGTGLAIDGSGVLSSTSTSAVTSVDTLTGDVVVKTQDNDATTGTSLVVDSGATTGVVKLKTIVAGTGITLSTDLSGNLQIDGSSDYVLPVATSTVLGGVKQGTGIAIAGDGTISSTVSYTLPVATASILGGVKQGSNVTIAGDGTLSVAAPYVLPVATASVLGGIKAGTGVSIAGDGTLSVTATGGVTTFNTRTGAVVLTSADITGVGGALLTDVAAAKYYDISAGSAGVLTASQLLCHYVAVRTITLGANFANSKGYAIGPPTATATCTVQVNGSTVGTVVFAIGNNLPTFATTGGSTVILNAGDRLTVSAPPTADTTLSSVSITFQGVAT